MDISACKISIIHKGFLRDFSHLEYLDISFNRQLSQEVLHNITYDLQFTNIKIFKLEAIQCGYGEGLTFKREYTYDLRHSSLQEINLSSNRINVFEPLSLSNIPNTLQRFAAADNRVMFSWAVLEIQHLKRLMYADFSRQYSSSSSFLSLVENDCNDTKVNSGKIKQKSFYSLANKKATNLKRLKSCLSEDITIPPRGKLNIYICLPESLKTILIPNCVIGSAKIPFIHNSFYDFSHVSHINAKGNMFKDITSGILFGKDSSYIDYSDNYISDINVEWIQHANLTYLDLSGNFLDAFFKSKNSEKLFKNQVFIRNISLARNKIGSLQNFLFVDTKNLQELDLSFNALQNLQFIGKSLKRMTLLNLTGNHIHTISQNEMRTLISATSDGLIIDLSENDILCTCDTLDFLKWVHHHSTGGRIIFFKNLKTYECTFQNSSKYSLFHLPYIIDNLEKQCSTYTGLIVGSAIIISVLIVIMIGGILYRNRWKLRYIYYMAKRGYKGSAHAQNMTQRNLFRHDAFISYADEDSATIIRKIISETEEKAGIKLCLHERDFTPGNDVAENITNAIRDSYRTVCFVSDHFLSSKWCMYEFNMAIMEQIHARGTDDNMVIKVCLTKSADLSVFVLFRIIKVCRQSRKTFLFLFCFFFFLLLFFFIFLYSHLRLSISP